MRQNELAYLLIGFGCGGLAAIVYAVALGMHR